MAQVIEIPVELARFHLPLAVPARLQSLLDRQDNGDQLTPAERDEAEELVELAESSRSSAYAPGSRRPLPPEFPAHVRRAVVERARNRCEYCTLS